MTGIRTKDPEQYQLLAAAHAVQGLIEAADERDPDFYGLLDLALTSNQLNANEVFVDLVLMASANHRVH